MGGFVGALGNDRIGSRVLLRKAQWLNEAGEQNDTRGGIEFSNSLYQLGAIHARHAVIRDYDVELFSFEEFQALFSIDRDFHAIANFLKERAANQ